MNLPAKTSSHAFTRAVAGALTAAALLTAGCAAFQPQTPEEIVARRTEERWQALIKGEFAKAYTYTQPGYRATVSEKDYIARFGKGGAWKSAEVFETKCEPERCTVRLRLTTQIFAPGFAQSIPETKGFISETWIKDDGQWWYYQSF